MSRREDLLDLLGIELPIVQAPMAGANDGALAAAVSAEGGLGSLPCAMLSTEAVQSEVARIRGITNRPFNLNFFCHQPPNEDPLRRAAWRARLEPYFAELGIALPPLDAPVVMRRPFDAAMCDVVEALRPHVVSFHFGLPPAALLQRVKAAGCKVLSSATTVAEAQWLEAHGADAVIAQGVEAGGHRGMFLAEDVACQVGTFALVPQVVDAVSVPVIAAGGIGDARGIVAALALGAAGVQLGTAYLRTPEALTTALHRRALAAARDDETALTNVFTGRPARGFMNRLVRELGPMCPDAPEFPTAAFDVAPLRARAEAASSVDFSPLWAGSAAALASEEPAGALTRRLAAEALQGSA